jgi:hypothetical protein
MSNYICECSGDSHKLNITDEKYNKLDRLGYVANANCENMRKDIQGRYYKIVFEDESHIAYIHVDDIESQSLWQYFLNWADKTLTSN